MTKRIIAYDYIKTFAVVLVGILHAWSVLKMNTEASGVSYRLYYAIVNAGVSLFVLTSGALLLSAPIVSIGSFFQKRLSRILVPFFLWGTLIYLIGVCMHRYDEVTSFKEMLLCYFPFILENKINVSHWYIHMLLALYVLTPILQRVVQLNDGKKTTEYVLIVLAMMVVLEQCYPTIYILTFASKLTTMLLLYVAGYYLSRYPIPGRYVSIVFFGVAAMLYAINQMIASPQLLIVELMALMLFGGIVQMRINPKNNFVTNCVTCISRYSYFIYLTHILVISLLCELLNATLYWWLPLAIGISAVLITAVGGRVLDCIPGRWKYYIGIA